jgi:hypothetical protein
VDEKVDAAELADRPPNQGAAFLRLGQIGVDRGRAAALLPDRGGGLFGRAGRLPVVHRHVGARLGEGDGDRTSHADAGAGDQGIPSGEVCPGHCGAVRGTAARA